MTARGPRVLVVDDQPKTADFLRRHAPDLALLGPSAEKDWAGNWSETEAALARAGKLPDLVVLDLRFDVPDEELLPDQRSLGETAAGKRDRRDRRDRQGLFILERLRRREPDLPVLLTTAHEEIPFEDEARRLRADAFTYTVGEDEATGEGLVRLVRRVLDERESPLSTGRFFWGRSAAMRDLRRRIASLAPTPLPLLLTGPTGSGKNFLVKEVIHPLSSRKGPLVSFDCATVPETLLQAALFGSVRGAYTGSVADRPGVFEVAAGGTLFIDEIENLSPDAQKALLTALNDGVVRRVGATATVPHTARIVAASNLDLKKRVTEGLFRADLLMRLNPALALELPPLATRREDLEDLSDDFAAAFFKDPANRLEITAQVRAAGGSEPDRVDTFELARGDDEVGRSRAPVVFALPRKGWQAIARHPWPGNVRQFAMVLADLLAATLYGRTAAAKDRSGRVVFSIDPRLLFDLLAEARQEDAPAAADSFVLPRPRVDSVEDFRRELERSAFRQTFHECEGDFSRMA
ncbi:MAG: sigma 54-interacting transcriptional regulator, partial [Acidobacteriota bacterium]